MVLNLQSFNYFMVFFKALFLVLFSSLFTLLRSALLYLILPLTFVWPAIFYTRRYPMGGKSPPHADISILLHNRLDLRKAFWWLYWNMAGLQSGQKKI